MASWLIYTIISIIVILVLIVIFYKMRHAKTGVWVRNAGGGYVNGLTPEESVAYCKSNNAKLSTLSDLNILNDGVFNYCQTSWYLKPDGSYGNMWLSNGINPNDCGPKGVNVYPDSHILTLNNKLGTFCTGVIPTTPEVGASKLFK